MWSKPSLFVSVECCDVDVCEFRMVLLLVASRLSTFSYNPNRNGSNQSKKQNFSSGMRSNIFRVIVRIIFKVVEPTTILCSYEDLGAKELCSMCVCERRALALVAILYAGRRRTWPTRTPAVLEPVVRRRVLISGRDNDI